MNLKELQEKGGFVPQTTVQKSVSWVDVDEQGNETQHSGTVRVKKHSAGTIEQMWGSAERVKDPSFTATLISKSVFLGDEGEEKLTYQQAYDLLPALAEAMVSAIDEVNPLKKRTVDKAKN